MQPSGYFLPIIDPSRINGASAASKVIDLKGHNFCEINVQIGATDAAATAFKLQESDTKASATALTDGVDITGLTFASSLPSATSDSTIWQLAFPTSGRKRYVLLVYTAASATGTDIAAHARFENSDSVTPTAAGLGLAGLAVLPSA